MPYRFTRLMKPAAFSACIVLAGLSTGHAAEKGIYGNWVAERIQGHKVNPKVKTTLDIAQDGKISGTGGCNRFMGGMEFKENTIKVSPAASTMMACTPYMMKQDYQFHKALGMVAGWQIRKDKLTLIDSKNREVLRLKRA